MTQPGEYQVGPFDSVHLYLQASGLLPGGETFSWGLRMYGTGDATAAATAGLVGAGAAVVAYHSRPATLIGSRALLHSVKLNAIATTGRYVLQSTNEATFADVPGGAPGGINFPPNQVALAVSLTTGYSRGPAHRGRFYLPLPCTDVSYDGLIGEQAATGIKTSSQTFIDNLNTAVSGWKVGVFSRKSGAAGHREVTGVQVGRVLDTQRRRRRSLLESYK